MKLAITTLLVALGVTLAGCQGSSGGMVTGTPSGATLAQGPKVGLSAPDVKFTNVEGKPRTARMKANWVTLIGFIESEGNACCMLSPALTEAAATYYDKPVRVIQVSLPTGKCPHGPGCVESCHVKSLRVLALCDSSRVAQKAYGNLAPGTVLAVDEYGKIAAIGTVDNISALYPKLDSLAEQAQKDARDPYLKLYMD